MEMIAPLAKVLAEANGIDWRKIQGSGDGGQVVEQDILNYLSRIMSGDEEPPATPVDAPPPDWNGEMPSMDLLAAAGVDSEIADFVASARSESVESVQFGHPELSTPDLGSDAMDFELELDDEDPHDHPAVTRDPDDMANAPRDADYPGNDTFDTPERPGLPITPGALDPGMPARPLTEPVGQPAPGYVDPAQDAPPHQGGGEGSDLPGPGESGPLDPERSGWHDEQPDEEPRASAGEAAAAGITGGLLSSLYRAEGAPTPESAPSAPEEAPAFSAHAQAEPQHIEPVIESMVVPQPAQPQAVPAVAASAVQGEELPIPERRFATLRLSFDASALASAKAHLAEHFGGREAPLAVFVARAAQRRLGVLNLGSVGVYGVGDEVMAVATPHLTGDFRAAVGDLHGAEGGEVRDLMVVDAGELGLDELQLPNGGLTLSLGRVRGGGATLTLTGDVSVRAGATFLQGVAELLESPIRLML